VSEQFTTAKSCCAKSLVEYEQSSIVSVRLDWLAHTPVSSEISDLLLFVSHCASQRKGMKFNDYFLMCVV